MSKIKVYKNSLDLSKGITSFVQELCNKKEVLNICLSGGSTPKALFEYWSHHEKNTMPWHKFRFFWGDERCVPPDDEMSNYGMTRRFLFDNVPVEEKNIFRVRGESDPEEEAARYGKVLTEKLPLINGIPNFDIVMLGLGDDGHTASIFPHEIHLWDSAENCVTASHPDSGQQRISVTGKIINNASCVLFLVTGENKAEKVNEIISQTEKFRNTYPAARVNPLSGELIWYLDQEAARLLP